MAVDLRSLAARQAAGPIATMACLSGVARGTRGHDTIIPTMDEGATMANAMAKGYACGSSWAAACGAGGLTAWGRGAQARGSEGVEGVHVDLYEAAGRGKA